MKQKLEKRDGFTLLEMLLVVAIVAVLVAIAIPLFNTQVAKARQAVDNANCRSAKTIAAVECITNDDGDFSKQTAQQWVTLATNGGIPRYGQVDSTAQLTCTISSDGSSVTFTYGPASSGGGNTNTSNTNTSNTNTGSVTVTDSSGKSYTITATGDWESIRANQPYGVSLTKGTVLSDTTGTYVVGDSNYASGDVRTKTLAQVQAAASTGSVVLYTVTSSTKVWIDADKNTDQWGNKSWPKSPQAGDLYSTNGSLYIARGSVSTTDNSLGSWIQLI